MQNRGVRAVTLIGFADPPAALLRALSPFTCRLKRFPGHATVNEALRQHGAEKLAELAENAIAEDAETHADPEHPPAGAAAHSGACLVLACGCRIYEIHGLEKTPRKLKATVRVEHGGRLHIDTLDFYSSRARQTLCRDLCRLFTQPPELIEADIARLVKRMEEYEPAPEDCRQDPAVAVSLSEPERREAEAFGRDPHLLDRIVEDYTACGLVGERANKLLCYLAAVSRKMDEPLSVLLLSSSGAGKTALQDATLLLCPPEDVVRLTSLTGKALFYKARHSLRHKVLALEEGVGAEEATYAIRNLISARELIIETTVKDLGSGKLTTMQNRVEGPTAIFITTTDPDPDPETRSRFFVTSVDESGSRPGRFSPCSAGARPWRP